MNEGCGAQDCGKPYYAKGWCKSHYNQFAAPECKEPDCHKPARRRGWCSMHYMRWYTHGDVNVVLGRRVESDDPGTRWCNRCEDFKPLEQFGSYTDSRNGATRYQSYCLKCQADNRKKNRDAGKASDPEAWSRRERESNIRRLYDMSAAQFDELLTGQGGVCANAACGVPHVEERGKRLQIDHDHKTGAARGLLCANCNTALGRVDDDVARLQGLIDYIDRWSNRHQ